MRTWTAKLTVSVADSWVADGFDLKNRIEEMQEMLSAMLPHAYEHELQIKIEIQSSPSEKVIDGLQDGTTEIKD